VPERKDEIYNNMTNDWGGEVLVGPHDQFLLTESREGAVDGREEDEFPTFQNSYISAVIYSVA